MPQPSNFVAAQPAMTTAASASSNRRNLVVIFLAGGCDTHNTVIPRTGANRTQYTALRPSLAMADNPATALDADWQLHPALTGLKALWDANKLAIIRNVGPLVYPTTKAAFQAQSVQVPAQLGSHADQQDLWETGIGDNPVADTGWLGRMSELLVPFNTGGNVTSLMSLAGPTDTFRAFDVRALGLGPNGFTQRNGDWSLTTGTDGIMTIVENLFQSHQDSNLLVQEYIDSNRRAVAASSVINAARDAAATPSLVPNSSYLGQSMGFVLRMASQQAALGNRRSIYFMVQGEYDQHANLLTDLAARFSVLDPVLKGAYDQTVNYGIDSNTTFVVYSEFGRAARENGDGTDHGWGGNAFVFGGGVKGGWYGQPYSLDPAGPDQLYSMCHMLPTTPVDTLIASLAKWMGVPDATANGVNPMNLLVPNLPNFSVRDLGLFN